MDVTWTCVLIHVSFLNLIIPMQTNYVTRCTYVTRDTTKCTSGSESQRTRRDVRLTWITSGQIVVSSHGLLGGGGGLHPSFRHRVQQTVHGLITSIIYPCIVHHADTSMELSQVVTRYFRGERGAPQ